MEGEREMDEAEEEDGEFYEDYDEGEGMSYVLIFLFVFLTYPSHCLHYRL
jgi:hypothetical protein